MSDLGLTETGFSLSELANPNLNVKIQTVATWLVLDDKACKDCMGLQGKSWIIDIEEIHALEDPIYGPVWDFDANVSLTHPHCRCSIILTPIIPEEETILQIKELMSEMSQVSGITSLEEYRRNVREVNRAMGEFRFQLLATNMMLVRFGRLSRAVGLPPEIERSIQMLIRLEFTVNQAIFSFRLLQVAMAGTMPFGWLMFAASMGATAVTATEMLTEFETR